MHKKSLSVLVLLVLCLSGAYATTPESWVNSSFAYDYSLGSDLAVTSGGEDALGYDLSWFAFPGNSDIGFESKFAMSFSIDADPAFLRMFLFFGPTFTTSLAGGVTGYLSVGPFYSYGDTESSVGSEEHQFGAGVDLGARFRFAGNERWDFALVAGTYADLSLLHVADGTRMSDWSGTVMPYIGFSFGSALRTRYPSRYPAYTVYRPVLYL
jgi:hypothetical protein